MTRHALISGASVAGPALAHRLAATGWDTTVVERAPRLRDEGHNIDVRGAGREVARRMGVEDDIRAAGTHERGLRFVDDDGRAVASFPVDTTSRLDGPTAELEILRGELSRVLYEHTRGSTDYRFDTQITGLDDRGDRVTATLSDGSTVDADLVVIAEGLRSRTRDLVFPGVNVRELGMYMAYLTIPRDPADDGWWNWHHVPGARGVHLRPDNLGTSRALLTFLSDVRGLDSLRRADQVAVLRATFADAGWITPRILDAIDDAPLYFDAVGQGVAARWSSGRVALLGDSAFCASPIGGGSTSLALIGAEVLAGELAGDTDHRAALTRYERILRPLVREVQDNRPPVELANPRTARGIRGLRAMARVGASRPARRIAGMFGRETPAPIEAFELPDYPAQPVARTR
ncbi:FAD-dependent monooxygenase [Pseudonocardia sp. HH130629-09]|uniref:FAD-dependent monooxygenase n=1 Tax=Pseudonocardia sp. HH130629-09 TaxID=1641402 RepID=UPI0006CB09BD|nr:FAD-dependent monooxygenase [Pseudonocardia sp. HH130629-09]ALE84073.1 hypothetical protein XF36_13770 [Pseudonocardia sp. HH130629-09]